MKTEAEHCGRHRRATRPEQRPGTVLVLVVALLGLLFVAGAAFLGTVGFESQSITSQQEVRDETSIIDAIETQILNELNRAWLGDNGVPYTNDLTASAATTDGVGGWVWATGATTDGLGGWVWPSTLVDVYGEVAGLHPLVAPIEPFFDAGTGAMLYSGSTDLELARRGIPWNVGYDDTTTAGLISVYDDYVNPPTSLPVVPFPVASGIQRVPAGFATDGVPDEYDMYAATALRDADGDGFTESLPRRLRRTLFATEVRRRMAAQVSDPEVNLALLNTEGMTQDDLFVSFRVIQHSGMASVSGSHNAILDSAFGLVNYPFPFNAHLSRTQNVYLSATEEPALRNRGFLLARNPAPSILVDQDMFQVLRDHLGGRWWPMDPNAAGDVASWQNWMDSASTDGVRDVRHSITTVNHDDHLLRMVRNGGNLVYDPVVVRTAAAVGFPLALYRALSMYPADHEDPLGPLNADDRTQLPDVIPMEFRGSAGFNLNFTAATTDDLDPRIGRLKLSLPSLDPTDLFGTLGYNPVNRPTARELYTVRDAFTLMMRNVVLNIGDYDGDATPNTAADQAAWQNDQGAQLAANLWDFVDSADDGREALPGTIHELTRIESPTGKSYFGVEKQPFITELFTLHQDLAIDTLPNGDDAYFIELFNPDTTPMSLNGYNLVISGGPPIPLTGNTIPAGGYLLVWSDPAGLLSLGGGINTGITLGPASAVDLTYTYAQLPHDPPPAGPISVVVDRFEANAAAAFSENWTGQFGQQPVDGTAAASLQRYIAGAAYPQRLTAVVPYYGDQGPGHTAGAINNYAPAAPWGPVYAIPADTGAMATAMPTTGCLLLLMRYAHEYDPAGPTSTPFNDKLREDLNLTNAGVYAGGAVAQRQSIDNGHMPLLGSVTGTENAHPTTPAAGATINGQVLNIPWGQLVFDYFTALPLFNTYDPTTGLAFTLGNYNTTSPTVDQAGLRVHGRVNINAAPWKVLAGVPRSHADELPLYSVLGGSTAFPQIADTDLNTATPEVLGQTLAKTIVAYRERRQITDAVGTTPGFVSIPDAGFFTVGELVFASSNFVPPADVASGPAYDFDAANLTDYLQAAAQLVALSDWVTTRGHVFTVYGHIRGVGERETVDRRSIRFQETVDRLPSMFDGQPPQRIGRRIVGPYSDARSD
ncbi:MAG: lamin tail domain-containing protein [bacterium]|nr:lamin tail domain-containing protein [bacterium]